MGGSMAVATLSISVPLALGAVLCMEKKGCSLHGEGNLALQAGSWLLS